MLMQNSGNFVKCLGLFSAVFFLTACAPSNSYWPSTSPGPRVVTCNGQKYNREGHQNTTALIAEMAGLEASHARRLAYFSQAPDDLWFLYSAPSVGVWGYVPFFWSYRSNIMNVLHSLHGGSHEAVIERRRNLKEQIISLRSRSNDEDGWKIGFLIHAMGDSYAHAYGALGDLHGYGEFLGHAFDNGEQDNRPDMIVMNNNYLIYIQYVQALFEALSDGSAKADLKGLNEFIAGVKAEVEVKHVSNSDFVQFVQTYTYCGNANRVHDQQPGNLATEELKKLEQDIERVKVSDFLSEMRDRL